MSVEMRLEELGMTGLGQVDESAFAGVAERHRRELQVHCYRMLGSYEDSEDLVQETFLRAWRRRDTFQGRSTFRAWLYRIATNACLDFLARHPRRRAGQCVAGGHPARGRIPWLQPYPDRMLEDGRAERASRTPPWSRRRPSSWRYLVAIQHLPPKQRAVLILRDVLGWPSRDLRTAGPASPR